MAVGRVSGLLRIYCDQITDHGNHKLLARVWPTHGIAGRVAFIGVDQKININTKMGVHRKWGNKSTDLRKLKTTRY